MVHKLTVRVSNSMKNHYLEKKKVLPAKETGEQHWASLAYVQHDRGHFSGASAGSSGRETQGKSGAKEEQCGEP